MVCIFTIFLQELSSLPWPTPISFYEIGMAFRKFGPVLKNKTNPRTPKQKLDRKFVFLYWLTFYIKVPIKNQAFVDFSSLVGV